MPPDPPSSTLLCLAPIAARPCFLQIGGTQQVGYDDDATQDDSERTAPESEPEGTPWGQLLSAGHSEGDFGADHVLIQVI